MENQKKVEPNKNELGAAPIEKFDTINALLEDLPSAETYARESIVGAQRDLEGDAARFEDSLTAVGGSPEDQKNFQDLTADAMARLQDGGEKLTSEVKKIGEQKPETPSFSISPENIAELDRRMQADKEAASAPIVIPPQESAQQAPEPAPAPESPKKLRTAQQIESIVAEDGTVIIDPGEMAALKEAQAKKQEAEKAKQDQEEAVKRQAAWDAEVAKGKQAREQKAQAPKTRQVINLRATPLPADLVPQKPERTSVQAETTNAKEPEPAANKKEIAQKKATKGPQPAVTTEEPARKRPVVNLRAPITGPRSNKTLEQLEAEVDADLKKKGGPKSAPSPTTGGSAQAALERAQKSMETFAAADKILADVEQKVEINEQIKRVADARLDITEIAKRRKDQIRKVRQSAKVFSEAPEILARAEQKAEKSDATRKAGGKAATSETTTESAQETSAPRPEAKRKEKKAGPTIEEVNEAILEAARKRKGAETAQEASAEGQENTRKTKRGRIIVAETQPEEKQGFWASFMRSQEEESSDKKDPNFLDTLKFKWHNMFYERAAEKTANIRTELIDADLKVAVIEEKLAANKRKIEEIKAANNGYITLKEEARFAKINNALEKDLGNEIVVRNAIEERYNSYKNTLTRYENNRREVAEKIIEQSNEQLAPFEAKLNELSLKRERVLAKIDNQNEEKKKLQDELEELKNIGLTRGTTVNEIKAEIKTINDLIAKEKGELDRIEHGYLPIGGLGGFGGMQRYEQIVQKIRNQRDMYAREANRTFEELVAPQSVKEETIRGGRKTINAGGRPAKAAEKGRTASGSKKKRPIGFTMETEGAAREDEQGEHETSELIRLWNRVTVENEGLTLSKDTLNNIILRETGRPVEASLKLSEFMEHLERYQKEVWSKKPELASFNKDVKAHLKQYRSQIKDKLQS